MLIECTVRECSESNLMQVRNVKSLFFAVITERINAFVAHGYRF